MRTNPKKDQQLSLGGSISFLVFGSWATIYGGLLMAHRTTYTSHKTTLEGSDAVFYGLIYVVIGASMAILGIMGIIANILKRK